MKNERKLYLEHYVYMATEDSYEEGELDKYGTDYVEYIHRVFDSIPELTKYLEEHYYIPSENWRYDELNNSLLTSYFVDFDGIRAKQTEIDQWKKGEKRLWSATVYLHLKVITEHPFDPKEWNFQEE